MIFFKNEMNYSLSNLDVVFGIPVMNEKNVMCVEGENNSQSLKNLFFLEKKKKLFLRVFIEK